MKDSAERAAWHVRYEWLRTRELRARDVRLVEERGTWRVVMTEGARCVGRGPTIAEALDAAMRNVTA